MKIQPSTKPTVLMAYSRFFGMSFMMSLALFAVAIAQPAVPELVVPLNESAYQPHELQLTWKASTGSETYRLQVSEDADFTEIIFDESQIADTVRFIPELMFDQTYFWRVNGSNDSLDSDFSTVWSFTTWDMISSGPDPVDLGAADRFVILAHTAVTNVPSSAITGDVGLSPTAGSFVDLTQIEVTGEIFTVDATGPAGSVTSPEMLTQATGDLSIAFNDAAGRTVNPIGIAGNLGGQTLYPGLYKSTGTLEISAGDLTLDGNGDESSVWIFQVASSFNMTTGRQVFLINDAKAENVFWQIGSAATFGTGTVMKGTIMAHTQVTMATGGTLEGRALALNENVTLQQNSISMSASDLPTDVNEQDISLPSAIKLSQNYPNPFNPITTIGFELPESAQTRLSVFNMLGQEVAVLVNEVRAAGSHQVSWNAQSASSGIYLYRLSVNGQTLTGKMSLMK